MTVLAPEPAPTAPEPAPPTQPAPVLRSGVPVLDRGGTHVQVGWDPERAVVLEPPAGTCPRALAGLLRSLDGSTSARDAEAGAEGMGLAPRAWHGVLADLAATGLLHHPRPTATQPVHLHGDGPLAALLEQWLPGPTVTVRRTRGRLPDWHGESSLPALVLLTDTLVTEPGVCAELVAARVPHLPVLLRDGTGLVGPLVLPGRTACLRCADLQRRDLDPAWPLVAAQLLGRTGDAPAAVVRATAALACAQVDAVLAGPGTGPPTSLAATLTADLGGGASRRTWHAHPGCGCGAAR